MATRTQKAAMKEKAEAGKAANAKAAKQAKAVAKAKPTKAKAGKAKKAASKPHSEDAQVTFIEEAPKKPSLAERFWHRLGQRAQDKEQVAHQHEAARAREEEEARRAEAERVQVAEEAERERARQEAAEERKRTAQSRRELQRVAEEEAERLAAEEKQRKADEARAKEEEKERIKAARLLQRKADREALAERERRAADEAEAEDRRKAEEREARRQAKQAEKAAAAELEPEMEFEEGSEPVARGSELVPSGKAATPLDEQAERMAAELSRRRSKPVVIVGEDLPIPKIPKARAEPADLDTSEPVVDEKYQTTPPPPAPTGLSVPEMFLLVANEGGWDERIERTRPGQLGGALAGAMMLDLLLHRRILVQRDRFTVVGEPTGDDALAAVVARLRRIQEKKGDIGSLAQMRLLAKWNRELLEPFKDRLAARGLAEHGHRMHLGLLHRSFVNVLDEESQERLRNKLRRAIAGGGTPEASSILLLGLLDAAGLLVSIVPDEAMDYNRKRLNGLLSGRDIMGYKVDPLLKATQEIAVRTILQNVRQLTQG